MSKLTTPHTQRGKRWKNKSTELRAPKQVGNILSTQGLCKSYSKGKLQVPVLQGVDFSVRNGEFSAIVGQSGSGKSTLLHLLATLDKPDAGTIHYEGNRIDSLSNRGRDVLRNSHFGMIFQFYHLLPELTALENVMLPRMISSSALGFFANRRKYSDRARQLLEQVGLAHRTNHRPSEMSGGEMQRTAIARALIAEPRILFADEPTGNLDRHTGVEIMNILRRLNQEEGVTIVMVTHDRSVAQQAHRVFNLFDSQITELDTERTHVS